MYVYDNPAYVTLQPFAYIFLQCISYWAIHLFPGAGGGGGGGGGWLVDLVLMLKQKTMRKGTCFSSWAVRSAVIFLNQKNGILVGNG